MAVARKNPCESNHFTFTHTLLVGTAGHGARDAEVALVVVTVLNLWDMALPLVSLVS
jgi:hypothetical protein